MPVLGKFLVIFKKHFARLQVLAFLKSFFGFYCLQELQLNTNPKKFTTHCFGCKNWHKKRISGKFRKKDNFGCYPKLLPIPDFGVNRWNEREKYNQNRVETFRKFVVNFLSTFRQIFNFSTIF